MSRIERDTAIKFKRAVATRRGRQVTETDKEWAQNLVSMANRDQRRELAIASLAAMWNMDELEVCKIMAKMLVMVYAGNGENSL